MCGLYLNNIPGTVLFICHHTVLHNKGKFVNTSMLHKLQSIYTVINIEIYIRGASFESASGCM